MTTATYYSEAFYDLAYIDGEGGKGGGGGSTSQEDEVSYRTSVIAKVIETVSEGPIQGLYTNAVDHAHAGMSIIFDSTPMQNSDGSYNFLGSVSGAPPQYAQRLGLPEQAYLSECGGFPSASSPYSVAQDLTYSSPVVYTTSTVDVDRMKIAIQFPGGLKKSDDQGNLGSTYVDFIIDRKPTSGSVWETVYNTRVWAYFTSATDIPGFMVYRPSESTNPNTTWDIRVSRQTADSTSSKIIDATKLDFITEVRDYQHTFPNTALVAMMLDAQNFGGQIPTRTYIIAGRNTVKVPTNRTWNRSTTWNGTDTATYSGVWDGTFKTELTDNPAWILYDLIINSRYGLAKYGNITEADVDKFSFYDAGAYCDGLCTVTPVGGGSLQERRYTFNAAISTREQAQRVLDAVAGMLDAHLQVVNGVITLFQDKPASVAKIINKSNVKDGLFERTGVDSTEIFTACNVDFNDRSDKKFLLRRVNETANSTKVGTYGLDGVARYGYNVKEIVAYGATTEGQARRAAKKIIYESMHQKSTIKFTMGLEGLNIGYWDIVSIYDEDYANQLGSGRVVSATTNTVTLDRAVVISGSPLLHIQNADGTVSEYSITTGAGSHSVLSISGSFSQIPAAYTIYSITSAVQPQKFRIIGTSEPKNGEVDFIGLLYDPNKYAAFEGEVVHAELPYSAPGGTAIGACSNLQATEYGVNSLDGTIQHGLEVSWTKPAYGVVRSYTLKYRLNGGGWNTHENIGSESALIFPVFNGHYDIVVYGVGIDGGVSQAATLQKTLDYTTGTGSSLPPPTNLTVQGGGTVFQGGDCPIQWTHNNTSGATLKDFQVQIWRGAAVVRTVTVPASAVSGAQTLTWNYTYNMNMEDGLSRSFTIKVAARDTGNKTSTYLGTDFSNPAPGQLTNVAVAGFFEGAKITFDTCTDTDFTGYIVWASQTVNFPLGQSTLYSVGGKDNYVAIDGLAVGQWFFKLAAYDTFGYEVDGSGLNVGPYYDTNTVAQPGIAQVGSLPANGNTDQYIQLTTNKTLYKWNGVAWEPVTSNSAWAQIIAANVIASHISANEIDGYLIRGDKVVANSITADKLSVSSLSAITASVGTLDAGIIYNHSHTQYMNLDAVDSSAYFIYAAGGNFWVRGDGVARIHGAYIADATIVTAKIADANVTTLKIQGQAITVPYATSGNGQLSFAVNIPAGISNAVLMILYTGSATTTSGGDYGTLSIYVNGSGVASQTLYFPPYFDSSGNYAHGPATAAIGVSLDRGSGSYTVQVVGSSMTLKSGNLIAFLGKR